MLHLIEKLVESPRSLLVWNKWKIPFLSKLLFYCVTNSHQRSDKTMAVFRVERNNVYTVMSNYHLRNKDFLKGKRDFVADVVIARRWWLHLCGAVLYQPIKYRRDSHRRMGAWKSRIYHKAAGVRWKGQFGGNRVHYLRAVATYVIGKPDVG